MLFRSTYTVIVTKGGCSSEDEVKVRVNQQGTDAVVADAGKDQTICLGEDVTLTASGGSQYTWSNGETTASIKVTPNKTTTYEVTVSDGKTSDTDQVTVTVEKVEAYAGEDETIDAGDEITLTASGGDSYEWNNGETTASITVSPGTTTTYTVTVTKGSCSSQDDIKVRVNQPSTDAVVADAGSDQSICLGEEVTLTASGGSQYTWSNGATTE